MTLSGRSALCALAVSVVPLMLAPLAGGARASDLELTAEEIQSRLVGNTIVGIEDGEFYAEYLSPNGVIYGQTKHETYRGSWRIVRNKLCLGYEPDDGKKMSWNCVFVGLSGDRISWNDDDEVSFARLLPGRAEKTAAGRAGEGGGVKSRTSHAPTPAATPAASKPALPGFFLFQPQQ